LSVGQTPVLLDGIDLMRREVVERKGTQPRTTSKTGVWHLAVVASNSKAAASNAKITLSAVMGPTVEDVAYRAGAP
jgi:hypothetical protein